MNQNVVGYLAQNKNSYAREALVAQLRKSGYAEADIQEGLAAVYGNGPVTLSGVKIELEVLRNSLAVLESKVRVLESGGIVSATVPAGETFSVPAGESFSGYQPQTPSYAERAVAQTAAEKSNLEENIGGKWFARIGIAALVIGISYFLKYAFDNDWIGETGRVIIGLVAGIILLGLGEKTIRKYSVYGQILSGGGLAVLYLSIFAAFNFYHLIAMPVAFFALMVVTAVGILLSLRYDALALFTVGSIGGFASPFLVSTGVNPQFALFSYVVLLDLAILVVSVFKKWRQANILGFAGTCIVFVSWWGEYYTSAQLFSTLFFLTIFFLIYSVSSLIYNLVKKEKSEGIEQLLTILSAVLFFAISYDLLESRYEAYLGFFAVIMAIYYFLGAYLVREITPEDDKLYNFLAFLTVGFATLAIPIQFDQNIITLGWIIEAVVLFVLAAKVKNRGILVFSIIVLALAMLRLVFFDTAEHLNVFVTVFNKTFFTFIFAIAAAYLLLFLSRMMLDEDEKESFNRKAMMTLFLLLANGLTIFAVSREIMVHYDHQADALMQTSYEKSQQLGKYGQSAGLRQDNTSDYSQVEKLRSRSSVVLSLFWLVYGICMLLVGVFVRHKILRVGGLLLLMLAILKLFFYDLWNLGQLYRIVSSISLGVVLLSISFAYQKYKDKIKEMI